jgi:hypothetical protein
MSHYRRANIEGGIFFFTLALADRSSDLLVRQIDRLRRSYEVMETPASCPEASANKRVGKARSAPLPTLPLL